MYRQQYFLSYDTHAFILSVMTGIPLKEILLNLLVWALSHPVVKLSTAVG